MQPIQDKPSRNEDEYFAREDLELRKALRARLDAIRRKAERSSHFMKCPRCGADLAEHEYHHVKIDRCPECKGTWLDGGELEHLLLVKRHQFGRFIGDLLGVTHK